MWKGFRRDDDGRNVELHSLGYDHAHAWMHVQGNARVTPVPERRVRRESWGQLSLKFKDHNFGFQHAAWYDGSGMRDVRGLTQIGRRGTIWVLSVRREERNELFVRYWSASYLTEERFRTRRETPPRGAPRANWPTKKTPAMRRSWKMASMTLPVNRR